MQLFKPNHIIKFGAPDQNKKPRYNSTISGKHNSTRGWLRVPDNGCALDYVVVLLTVEV